MSKFKDPYKRLEEINSELEVLEIKEKEFGEKHWKRKPMELEKVESEIMFLMFEKYSIECSIKYFEKKIAQTKEAKK